MCTELGADFKNFWHEARKKSISALYPFYVHGVIFCAF